jgi:aldehyde:ferredoxin oxidoreductase
MYQPLLEVDLTTGSIQPFDVPRDLWERWIGGTGLGLYLLSQEIRRGMRATDPACPVFVLTGPLTGTSVPQSSDWTIVTLNAESRKHICASHGHGHFGARLRHAGWDGVILRGRSEKPVYLWIDDGTPELIPADKLWGLDTFETQRVATARHGRQGREVSVACIGPAGENLVEGASVRSDSAYGANQGGSGVVWGAKNFKAIVVCGTKPVRVKDPQQLDALATEWLEAIRASRPPEWPESAHFEGMAYMTGPLADLGWIPGKNFTDPETGVRWAAALRRELPKWKIEGMGSWNCDAACHYRATCTTGPMAGVEFAGYGGEIMEEVGPNMGIEDPGIAFTIAGMVDGYGMAAKSAPRTIAMLMEAFNAGAIGLDQTDGIDLTWGNHESVFKLLELTMAREGIGDLIAHGLRRTAEALGIQQYSVHMHGVGFNDHDLRATPMALFQAQVASGAGPAWQSLVETTMGRPEPDLGYPAAVESDDLDRLGEVTSVTQKAKLFHDSLGVCYFAEIGVDQIRRLQTGCLEAATGFSMTPEESLTVGHRIVTLQRLINVYLGYRPGDDFDMADRLFEKIPTGPAAGHGLTKPEFERIRDSFYELQGWSLETGAPTEESLETLGLAGLTVGACG